MYTHIRRTLPDIVAEIDEKIFDCETNLSEMGNPMPLDEKEKLKMLWEMISAFSEKFKSSVLSTYNEKNKKYRQDLMGGAKIKMIFNDLYADILKPSHQASNKYSDKMIREAINTHQGDNLPGFLSAGAFMS